jgi:hypothetical protein
MNSVMIHVLLELEGTTGSCGTGSDREGEGHSGLCESNSRIPDPKRPLPGKPICRQTASATMYVYKTRFFKISFWKDFQKLEPTTTTECKRKLLS